MAEPLGKDGIIHDRTVKPVKNQFEAVGRSLAIYGPGLPARRFEDNLWPTAALRRYAVVGQGLAEQWRPLSCTVSGYMNTT